ncbi:MAG: primosomal protein N' [Candidatus Omnitrophota bacterium]
MLYAKVVFGLPVDGPFDYIVPDGLAKKIAVGSRVWVNFSFKKRLGYCVGLSHKTNVLKLKEISALIDNQAILPENILALCRKLAVYYCCSWGEAIETALPLALRKGVKLKIELPPEPKNPPKKIISDKPSVTFVQASAEIRFSFYVEQIKEALGQKKSAIVLLTDTNSIFGLKQLLEGLGLGAELAVLHRNQPKEAEIWLKIRQGQVRIVIGTRSAVFAAMPDLGLIIIDEEHDSVYKQEQVPHYHAREVALMRSGIEKVKAVLGGAAPSVESFYLISQGKIKRITLEDKRIIPEIKIIQKRYKEVISRFLEDAILASLAAKEKILIFINRKGFATFAACNSCGAALKCPKCDIALVYYFNQGLLKCNHCNFKLEPPKICPHCNAGYIKYSGLGTQKLESELARIFPQAKIGEGAGNDIMVATSSVLKTSSRFALSAVLAIDNSLNRPDFRSTEKAFILLWNLLGLTQKRFIIETQVPNQHCFAALAKNEADKFYAQELSQRRQLGLPPYQHQVLIKLRAKQEEKAKNAALGLFEKLKEANKTKTIEVVSVNAGQPPKLRGNYYWQVLLKAKDIVKLNKFLKINLKSLPHSGIIVTIDVDPV